MWLLYKKDTEDFSFEIRRYIKFIVKNNLFTNIKVIEKIINIFIPCFIVIITIIQFDFSFIKFNNRNAKLFLFVYIYLFTLYYVEFYKLLLKIKKIYINITLNLL